MRKAIPIILFLIIILFSALILTEIFAVTNFFAEYTEIFYSSYSVFIILSFIIFLTILFKKESSIQNKTVKIIYKDSEPNKKNKQKQTISDSPQFHIIDKIANNITSGLSNIKKHKLYSEQLLKNLSKECEIAQGIVFILNKEQEKFLISGSYAYYSEEKEKSFKIGEGIAGQVVRDKKFIYIDNIPENYITILSGLGKGSPKYLIIFPIINGNDQVVGIVEFASFSPIETNSEIIFKKVSTNISANIESFVYKK